MTITDNQNTHVHACKQCPLVFHSTKSLSLHNRVHIHEIVAHYGENHTEEIKKKDDDRYYCPYCPYHTSSPDLMMTHATACLKDGVASKALEDNDCFEVTCSDIVRPSNGRTFFAGSSHSTIPVSRPPSPVSNCSRQSVTSNESFSIPTGVYPHGNDEPTAPDVVPSVAVANNESEDSSASTNSEAQLLALADNDAYVKYNPFFGLVVHPESGASICLFCQKAFLVTTILSHFFSNHQLATFINRHNKMVSNESEKLIANRVQEQLFDMGAKEFPDLGFYISPTQAALPLIELLPYESGYMCNLCPVPGQTPTAFFTPKIRTMQNHFSKTHKGFNNDNYTACHIQHLYNDRAHLKYFRVARVFQGGEIASTITDLGQERFKAFLQDNPDYCSTNKPSTMVSDVRVQSLFYTKVHWYDLSKVVAGADTTESRIALHDWTHNLYKKRTDHDIFFDNQLEKLVRAYFQYIQDILRDGSLCIYYERCKVMHDDRNSPFPTEGLNPLQPKTARRYFDLWYKYVRMMILGSTNSVGSHPNGDFTSFGAKVIDDSTKQVTIQFVFDMMEIIDNAANNQDHAANNQDHAANNQDHAATNNQDHAATNNQDHAANNQDHAANNQDHAATNNQDHAANNQDHAANNQDHAAKLSQLAFPKIHQYFMHLISEKPPPTMHMYRSSVTVFVAFKQIMYTGQWNPVRHIKQTPTILKYCFRCIALVDMLLEKGDLHLDKEIMMDEESMEQQDQANLTYEFEDMMTSSDDSSFED